MGKQHQCNAFLRHDQDHSLRIAFVNLLAADPTWEAKRNFNERLKHLPPVKILSIPEQAVQTQRRLNACFVKNFALLCNLAESTTRFVRAAPRLGGIDYSPLLRALASHQMA